MQKEKNPAAGSSRVLVFNALGRAFEDQDHTENLIDLQAERIRRRFGVSPHLARATAEIAFENRARFA